MCEYCGIRPGKRSEYIGKGHHWCLMNDNYDNNNILMMLKNGNQLFSLSINYCPMCGRKLGE